MTRRIIIFICVATLLCTIAHNISASIPDPNEIRQIVMPKAVEIPVKYKCPVHGVTEAVLTIEVDEIRKIYCKKCALNLIVNFFDLNLPRLEVEK